MSRVPFIPPAIPRLRPSPPAGEGWSHELKLDGYRVQLHKAGRAVTIYSRNGADFTRRFPTIAATVLALTVSSCIIDGELVAAGASGEPDFRALLHGRTRGACVYAFDLMEWRGRDIRERPLVQRRAQLEAILKRGASRFIRFSESFLDANALLAECALRGLEGIVSKRKDAPYRSGTRSGWIEVKTPEWKEANRYRAKLREAAPLRLYCRRGWRGMRHVACGYCSIGVADSVARRLQAAGPNAIGFFYYSGHGASDGTTNYLIPVDVKTTETGELWDQSMRLTEITRKLKAEAGNATHFVVFDACRNTLKLIQLGSRALVQFKGFVRIAQENGMLIAYATEEGELASDVGT